MREKSLLLLFFGFILIVSPIRGEGEKVLGVLYTGDPYPGVSPYRAMLEDAMISVTPVQGSREHYAGIDWTDIYKSLRVYMPRSYQNYLEKYEVVVLSDTNRRIFTSDQHSWLRDGVFEEGNGLVMVGGLETFGAGFGHEPWAGTPTEEILPVEIPAGDPDWVSGNVPIGITPGGYQNEFISSLPYQPRPEYLRLGTDGNLVFAKEGATVLARWISPKFNDPPCYATWDIGEGRTYAMCHDWTPGGGWEMSRWPYYGDYAINLMLYLAQWDLPDDYLTVHQYREAIQRLSVGKSTLFSLVEFVESFGGSAREIENEIIEMEDTKAGAEDLYLAQDYSGALEKARQALSKLESIQSLAVKVKDQALFWIYLIEWLSISGVSIVAGVTLWTLMIRKRMYKEVRITRRGSR